MTWTKKELKLISLEHKQVKVEKEVIESKENITILEFDLTTKIQEIKIWNQSRWQNGKKHEEEAMEVRENIVKLEN